MEDFCLKCFCSALSLLVLVASMVPTSEAAIGQDQSVQETQLLASIVKALKAKKTQTGPRPTNDLKTAENLIAAMIDNKEYDSLTQLLQFIRQKEKQAATAKCLKTFKSRSVCTNSAMFYIWQQLEAKKLLRGGNNAAKIDPDIIDT